MRVIDIIAKKRDGGQLSRNEIDFFVQGYTNGDIPDYQAAALAMAILLRGMTPQETDDLTMAMANSGKILDLTGVVPVAVDKHSTGGVGDKTTLVAEPVVAACGLAVGKMSGHGLDYSGGTLDKMESIPGFRTDLSTEEFIQQLRTVGLVLTGQTADLAPADGKLYALRDVTATVHSIPLIASSIMSKKIAEGAQAIVLDVKVGLGAFAQNLDEGRQLAEVMVSIARVVGQRAVALLADMNQPLGNAVGNALEVKEAIQTLQGGGPADFLEHSLVVAGHMLVSGGKAADHREGMRLAQAALEDGRGLEMFKRLVAAQGGDVTVIENPDRLPKARFVEVVSSPRTGYLREIHARMVGETVVSLGGGRAKKGDPIDYAVGVIVHQKVGDRVDAGDPLFTIHANDRARQDDARLRLLQAHAWSDAPVEPLPLFYGVVQD